MSKFHLQLPAIKTHFRIQYPDKSFLIGSCFTENMGAKMQHYLMDTFENPHGILFNPISVYNALVDCLDKKTYSTSDLFCFNNIWNSWHHHTRYSGVTQEEALFKINDSIEKAHHLLKNAHHLVITFGSSWLYQLTTDAEYGETGLVVANNHKAPANWFVKRLMEPQELQSLLDKLILRLKKFNPSLHIIFTISPVRHLREGAIENNRSKAVLIQGVHAAVQMHDQVEYFPAYEYVIDDLRDYRFYAEDLVHPNYAATNYVWEKWVASYMDAATQELMHKINELQQAVAHKPFFKGSEAHQHFLEKTIHKVRELQKSFPVIPVENQLHFLEQELINSRNLEI
jgi:hypothetical protein